MESAVFTPEQIEAAIRYGMRGDRRRYELASPEAAQKGATYGSNLGHYQNVAQKCLNEGDYRQAAEKSWGVYAQTLKLTCAGYGIGVSTHSNLISVAQQLTALAHASDVATGNILRQGFQSARSLHQHFYEDDLEAGEVERSVQEVMDAIDLLQTLFGRR